CLVSHDGVFDLVSEYGSTEELWFPEWEFRGPPWTNPELYRRLSPSSYVENFKTPTLVVQGELDFRVPVEQGLGMFTALERRGMQFGHAEQARERAGPGYHAGSALALESRRRRHGVGHLSRSSCRRPARDSACTTGRDQRGGAGAAGAAGHRRERDGQIRRS